VEPERDCPTCGHTQPMDAFYENCSECKNCKRQRSQQNRAVQARKIAAFERFVDVLTVLVHCTSDPRPDQRAELVRGAS
jgi:predicted nucleic acid-binding Zn ribbon protein